MIWRKRSAQIAKSALFGGCENKEMTLDRVLSKQQPRVISVLSYYLTSLVNLSFCRLDLRFFETLWLILAPSCQSCLHLSVPFETSRFNTCLCHLPLLSYAIISSSYVTYYLTIVIRLPTFNYFIAYCIGQLCIFSFLL